MPPKPNPKSDSKPNSKPVSPFKLSRISTIPKSTTDSNGGSNITNEKELLKAYPKLKLDCGRKVYKMKLGEEYDTPEFRRNLRMWLISVAGRIATSMNAVHKDNESSLYPLLWDLLKEVCLLSNNATTILSQVTSEATPEEKELAAGIVALQVKERKSLSTTRSAQESTSEDEDEDGDGIPDFFDTSCRDDILAVYVAVEKQLRKPKAGGGSAGRVEFALCFLGSPIIRTIMEAKLSLVADKNKGFFQLCSYMCNVFYTAHRETGEYPPVVYGVYTDHSVWQFLELRIIEDADGTNKPTITCTKTFNFTDAEGSALLPQALNVLQFLFQCANVPANFCAESSICAVEELIKADGEQLVACFL